MMLKTNNKMDITEIEKQDWVSVGWVLDYLNDKDISYELDEFGLNTDICHIDVYDGMIFKDEKWSIDWENCPECKTNEIP